MRRVHDQPVMTASRSHAFCKALAEETGRRVNRYASIDSVTDRLGMDPNKAAVLAAELDDAGQVRVGGGHSVWLTEAGRQLLKTAAPTDRPRARRRGPARRSRKP